MTTLSAEFISEEHAASLTIYRVLRLEIEDRVLAYLRAYEEVELHKRGEREGVADVISGKWSVREALRSSDLHLNSERIAILENEGMNPAASRGLILANAVDSHRLPLDSFLTALTNKRGTKSVGFALG